MATRGMVESRGGINNVYSRSLADFNTKVGVGHSGNFPIFVFAPCPLLNLIYPKTAKNFVSKIFVCRAKS